jgi:hypothetical protein
MDRNKKTEGKKTRYQQLCAAYEKVQQEYTQVERDCLSFGDELVRNFIRYFEVPDGLLSYYKITEDNHFDLVLPDMAHALRYHKDGFWDFGLGLTITSSIEEKAEDLILIHLFVKKDFNGKFYTRIARDKTEFEIELHNPESYHPFFDFLKDSVIESYEEGFQEFIGQHTTRKLGYRI